MTSDKSMFETFESYDGNCVKFNNDEPCLVKGKGCIKLTKMIICDNAYFVDGMNYNLLCVAQLNISGYKVDFSHKKENLGSILMSSYFSISASLCSYSSSGNLTTKCISVFECDLVFRDCDLAVNGSYTPAWVFTLFLVGIPS